MILRRNVKSKRRLRLWPTPWRKKKRRTKAMIRWLLKKPARRRDWSPYIWWKVHSIWKYRWSWWENRCCSPVGWRRSATIRMWWPDRCLRIRCWWNGAAMRKKSISIMWSVDRYVMKTNRLQYLWNGTIWNRSSGLFRSKHSVKIRVRWWSMPLNCFVPTNGR